MTNKTFKEWSSKTTWHGISDLANAKTCCSRTSWFIVLSVSFLMFTSGVYSHIRDYVRGDIWVTITQLEEKPNGIEFPNLVICDLNLVSKKILHQINMSIDAARFVVTTMRSNKAEEYEEKAFIEFLRSKNTTDRSISNWVQEIAPDCEDLLLTCSIGPSASAEKFPCCERVTDIFVPERGRCFFFEIPPRLMKQFPQKEVGLPGSLEMLANPFQEDYAPLQDEDVGFETGLLIYAGYDALSSLYSTPVAVTPNSKSYISMSASESRIKYRNKTFPDLLYIYYPPLPCILNGSLKVLSGVYQRESCMEDCRLQAELEICGCVRFHSVDDKNALCDPIQWQSCIRKLSDFYKSYEELMANCRNDCKRSCSHTNVKLRQSTSSMYRAISKNDSFTPIEIFFESVAVLTSEQQERMPIETLIANIGGTFGVWAGVSLITIYQGLLFFTCGVVTAVKK